ncbi:MAG: hypothetical protein K2M73_09560 [Lachnospiraceae bacterium]|nr:hypothetical protein [Lachnospiraceae bacterium]
MTKTYVELLEDIATNRWRRDDNRLKKIKKIKRAIVEKSSKIETMEVLVKYIQEVMRIVINLELYRAVGFNLKFFKKVFKSKIKCKEDRAEIAKRYMRQFATNYRLYVINKNATCGAYSSR